MSWVVCSAAQKSEAMPRRQAAMHARATGHADLTSGSHLATVSTIKTRHVCGMTQTVFCLAGRRSEQRRQFWACSAGAGDAHAGGADPHPQALRICGGPCVRVSPGSRRLRSPGHQRHRHSLLLLTSWPTETCIHTSSRCCCASDSPMPSSYNLAGERGAQEQGLLSCCAT